jgi:threonine/homoserine/homoserine lactone efflux protein
MHITAVGSFAVLALTLIAIPGPDWAYVVTASVRDHVVAMAVGGIVAGYVLITGLAVAGVAPVITHVPHALDVLTVTGASYLAYLGVHTLRTNRRAHAIDLVTRPHGPQTTTNHLLHGMGVSALNPKGLLIFVSILPQFADPAASWPIQGQLVTLAAVYVTLTGAFYLGLGFTAQRVLRGRPGFTRALTGAGGIAMIVVAAALMTEEVSSFH